MNQRVRNDSESWPLIFDITGSNLCTHFEVIGLETVDLGAGITIGQ